MGKMLDGKELNSLEILRFIGLIVAVINLVGLVAFIIMHHNQDEPFAFWEGVSMWPTEAIRYIALVLAFHFFMEVLKFPQELKTKLSNSFALSLSGEKNAPENDVISGRKFLKGRVLIHEWMEKIMHAGLKNSFWFVVWLIVVIGLILCFGATNTPYRGDWVWWLDKVLSVFWVVVFNLLLIWVLGIVIRLADAIQKINDNENGVVWPDAVCLWYRDTLEINMVNLHNWVTVRVIGELTEQVSKLLLYPFVVVALLILSRYSYFDKWVMQPGLQVMFCLVVAALVWCDYRLKSVAVEAKNTAIKQLKRRMILQGDNDQGKRLEKLVAMTEEYAADAYKPFLQRPLFLGLLVLIISMAIGYSDYAALMAKLF